MDLTQLSKTIWNSTTSVLQTKNSLSYCNAWLDLIEKLLKENNDQQAQSQAEATLFLLANTIKEDNRVVKTLDAQRLSSVLFAAITHLKHSELSVWYICDILEILLKEQVDFDFQILLFGITDSRKVLRRKSVIFTIKLLERYKELQQKVLEWLQPQLQSAQQFEFKSMHKVQYILNFLTSFLQKVEEEQILKSIISIVLELTQTLNENAVIIQHCYLCLIPVMASRFLQFTPEILSFLVKTPPSMPSEDVVNAYLQCISHCFNHAKHQFAHAQYQDSLFQLLAPVYSIFADLLLHHNLSIQKIAANALEGLMLKIEDPSLLKLSEDHLLQQGLDCLSLSQNSLTASPVQKIAQSFIFAIKQTFGQDLENSQGLEINSHLSKYETEKYALLFQVLRCFFKQFGKFVEKNEMAQILQLLDRICPQFIDSNDYKKCVGEAINSIGLVNFTAVLPLRLIQHQFTEKDYEFSSRSWMLPIIIAYARNVDLQGFSDCLLPQWLALDKLIENQVNSASIVEQQIAVKRNALIHQIWQCFPTCCSGAARSLSPQPMFSKMLPKLGNLIEKQPHLASYIFQGISHIQQREDCLEVLRANDSKLLPIIFNYYVNNFEKASKQQLKSLLQAYPITNEFLSKGCKSLIKKFMDSQQRALLDIAALIFPKYGQLHQLMEILQKFVTKYISFEPKVQKRMFQILLIFGQQDILIDYSLQIIQDENIKMFESSLKPRLQLLDLLLKKKNYQNFAFHFAFLVQHVKSSNTNVRNLSRQIILEALSQYPITESLKLALAGLVHSNQEIKVNSMFMLSRILSGQTSADKTILKQCLDTVLFLLKQSEIFGKYQVTLVKNGLKYIRLYVSYSQPEEIELSSLSEAILNTSEQCNSSKVKYWIKKIIKKLIKALGEQEVIKHFPKNLIKNLRKRTGKKARSQSIDEEHKQPVEIQMDSQGKMDFTSDFQEDKQEDQQDSTQKSNDYKQDNTKHSRSGIIVKESGDKFRSKKSGGDLKKDNVDPYAYIQFHPGLLNRRKKIALNEVLKKTKKGVFKGMKTRKLK